MAWQFGNNSVMESVVLYLTFSGNVLGYFDGTCLWSDLRSEIINPVIA
jgi:hypothetical protein